MKSRFTTSLALLLASGALAAAQTGGGNASWLQVKSITIDHTKAGPVDLKNFTMAFVEHDPSMAAASQGGSVQHTTTCGADAVTCPADLVFASDSACQSLLNWEIESYSSADGSLFAWIGVPVVSHLTDTVIYMCYGKSAVGTFQGKAKGSSWDSASAAVYHMGNSLLHGSSSASPPLSIGAPQPGSNPAGPVGLTGKIAGAQHFITGGQTSGVYAYSALNSGMGTGVAGSTISGWVRFASPTPSGSPFSPNNTTATVFGIESGSKETMLNLVTINSAGKLQFTLGSKQRVVTAPQAIAVGQWYHVAATFDGTTMKLYLNGELAASAVTGPVTRSDGPLRLGSSASAAGRFADIGLDEVRFSAVARTADWIRAEFTNQNGLAPFYSLPAAPPRRTPAFSVAPSSLSYKIRTPVSYPGERFLFPAKQILTITTASASQPWTLAISGALSNSCRYSETCFTVTDEFSGVPVTYGTGTRRVAVNWYGRQPPNLAPGNYGGLITISAVGSASVALVNMNLGIVGADDSTVMPEVKSTALQTVGCGLSDPSLDYSFAVRCDIPNEAPTADPALTQPVLGATAKDLTFGQTIRRITGPGCTTEYGSTTAFSALSTYIIDTCGVHRTADATLVRATYPGNIGSLSMSATDDQIYYYLTGSALHSYNFVTGSDKLLADYGAAPYSFKEIYAGGTAGATDDDWLSFYEYTSPAFPKICAVNAGALRTAGSPNGSNTYCGTYSGKIPLTAIDWAGTSEIDNPTGKRFTFVSAVPLSVVFSNGPAGSGILTQDFIIPEWPGWPQNNDDGDCTAGENCYDANHWTHLALFKDRDGQVKIFGNFEDVIQVHNVVSTFRLNAGLKIFRPVEEGGGLQFIGRAEQDTQPGCANSINGCVTAFIERGLRFAARISGAVAGSATTLTLSASPGWPAGATRPVRIQNASGGWSCMNGAWTATVVSATTVSIPARCTATGDFSRALIGDATQPFAGAANDNRGQIAVWRPGRQVHRIAMHRSVTWNDVPGTGVNAYYTNPRASISRDGRYVAFNSNWGALDFDGGSVYVATTGLGNPGDQIKVNSLSPTSTSAILTWATQNLQSCQVEVSADSNFQTVLENFTVSALASNTLTLGRIAPLKPSSNYWVRLTCGFQVETAAFSTTN